MLLLLFSLLLAAASVMALPQDPHLIPVIATLTLPNGSLTTSTWTHTPIVVDGAGPLPSNWKYFFLTETTTATVTDPTIAALAASTVYAPPVTTTLTKPGVPIPMPVQYVYITVTSPGTRTVTEERTVERSVTVTETASGTAGCEPPPPGEEVEETVIVTESRTSTTTVLTYIQPTVTATSTPTEEEETVIVTESQTSTTTVLTYIQPTVTSTSSNSSDSPSSKSTVTVYTSTCPSCAPGSTSSTAIPPPTTTDSSTSTTSTLPTTSAPDSEPTSDVLFTLPTAVPSAPDFADSLNLASIPHPANHMTTTNHPFGPIPHPCYAETTGLAMYCSPYDIEVHSIYYEDYSASPPPSSAAATPPPSPSPT
ncbi:hypothetical protein BJ508DRAFT_58452 [Ascobolus immersus RN42]|uniref:Uncharacterized protein n=1 Tax=Ascobolus immersus RN42 TaxID=1160509 RepID=A0A3N4HLB4_ASCIM|nr:hypothetical protein BJ508DRAFT_58452 [Ascobolus immersus RN42]